MRGDDDLRQLEQRRIGARLGGVHVEPGSEDLTGRDGVGESLLVDQTATGGVDHDDALLGTGQLLSADQPEGFRRLGQVHREHVGTLEEFIEADEFDAELRGASRGHVGVVRDDVGLEGREALREQLPDPAEPDDTDGFAEDLHAVEARPLPFVLTQRRIGCGDLAGRGQQQADGVLCGGVDVRGRRIDDHDPAFGGSRHVHVVQAHSGAGDDLQIGSGSQDLGINLSGRSDQDRIGVLDGFEQFGTIRAVDPAHLDILTQCSNGGLGQFVGDQDDWAAGGTHGDFLLVSGRARCSTGSKLSWQLQRSA